MDDNSDESDASLLSNDSENDDEESGPNSIDGVFVVSDGHVSADEGDGSDSNDSGNEQQQEENDKDDNDNGEQEQTGAAAVIPQSPKLERVEGGFWCYKCKKTIKGQPQKFKQHYAEMHGPQATDKVFCCGRCKRSYKSARSLTKHLKDVHKHEYKATPRAGKKKETVKKEQPQTAEEIKEVRRKAKSYLFSQAIDVDKQKQKRKQIQKKAGAAAAASSVKPKRPVAIDLSNERPIKKEIKEEPKPKKNEIKMIKEKNKKDKEVQKAIEDSIEEERRTIMKLEVEAKIAVAMAKAELKTRREMAVSQEEAIGRARVDEVIAHQKERNKIKLQIVVADVESRGNAKLAQAQEELDKIQLKITENSR